MIVLGAASALARARSLQFGNNFVDCRRRAYDWVRDGAASEGAKPFSAPREIHLRNRDVFALDVTPDINLSPVEERLHANVFAFCRGGRELSPEFRRLIFIIPFELRVARRKISFLCAS